MPEQETLPTTEAKKHRRPRAPKVEKPQEDAPEQKVSRYQAFSLMRVHRKDIKGAPYNPRVIDPQARQKLMLSIKKNGLVETLVWNRRSGNLVGGHQRLGILDDLEDSPDFYLDVAAVDLSPEQEKAANVALNNQSLTGQYDNELLIQVLKEVGDVYATGMDPVELEFLGVQQDAISDLFKLENQSQATQEAVKEVEAIAKMKNARKKHQAEDREKHSEEFYAVVIFKSAPEKAKLMLHYGLSAHERYIEGRLICDDLGIDLDAAEEEKK